MKTDKHGALKRTRQKGVLLMQTEEDIELAEECCTHPDCIYRMYIEAGKTAICGYAVTEGGVRGCKISECDKYSLGTKKRPRTNMNYELYWEYEDLYEQSIDNLI